MCTIIDKVATKKMKKDLKSKKIAYAAYAWKVVLIMDGKWMAPYQRTVYKQVNKIEPIALEPKVRVSSPELLKPYYTSGVFHLVTTRKLARLVATYEKNCCSSAEFKVVKVSFNPKDLVCVGSVSSYDKGEYKFPDGNNSICVTAFKFVDKIPEGE